MFVVAGARRTAMIAVQTDSGCGQMNERPTGKPNTPRATGSMFFGNALRPAALAIGGALISLLFAAHVGAAGPLDTVTKTVGDVTKSVTQTTDTVVKTVDTTASGASNVVSHVSQAAEPVTESVTRTEQSAAGGAAPVAQSVERTTDTVAASAAPATRQADGATRTVTATTQTVTTVAQPISQPAPQIVGALGQPAQPVVQAVAQPLNTAMQPVAQAVAVTTAPVASVVAPVAQQVQTIAPAVTAPVQAVTKPVIQPIARVAAPVMQVAAPVEPIIAPATQAAVVAVAPLAASITPIVQQAPPAIAPAAMTIAPASISVAPRLDPLPIIAASRPAPAERTQPVRIAHGADQAEPPAPAAAPLVLPTMIVTTISPASQTNHEQAAPPATVGTRTATDAMHAAQPVTTMSVIMPGRLFVALSAIAVQPTRARIMTAPSGVLVSDPARVILRAASSSPISPALPYGPLAMMSGAAGTSAGQGFSFLLAILAAAWALLLAGRRILPLILTLSQPTYRPVVSPG